MLGLVALVSVLWEIFEFSYDSFRIYVLHHDLLQPVNHLTQPSNADTMGDLIFGLVGASVVLALLKILNRKG